MVKINEEMLNAKVGLINLVNSVICTAIPIIEKALLGVTGRIVKRNGSFTAIAKKHIRPCLLAIDKPNLTALIINNHKPIETAYVNSDDDGDDGFVGEGVISLKVRAFTDDCTPMVYHTGIHDIGPIEFGCLTGLYEVDYDKYRSDLTLKDAKNLIREAQRLRKLADAAAVRAKILFSE